MSRKVSEKEYEKTLTFRLRQWLSGAKDPFLDTVEMKPQQQIRESEEVIREHELSIRGSWSTHMMWSTMRRYGCSANSISCFL